MAATFLPTTQRTVGNTLADIVPQGNPAATPASRVRTWWVRAVNVNATADGTLDLYVVDTGVAANANDGYRAKNYPVPFNTPNSAPDMEQRLVLTAGQKLQAKANATGFVAISCEIVEDDA